MLSIIISWHMPHTTHLFSIQLCAMKSFSGIHSTNNFQEYYINLNKSILLLYNSNKLFYV